MEEEDEMNDAIVDSSRDRDGLLCALLRLKVSSWPPSSLFVLRKTLLRSYLSRNQNYLAITQSEYAGGFRRRGVLTDEEHGRVHTTDGLPLRALDRRGVSYGMVLIQHPKTCRLRRGWGHFLRASGVRQEDDAHVGDVVEIWAFRSPACPPTGLGLVLLHYTKDEDAQITASSGLSLEQEEEGRCTTTTSTADEDDGGITTMSADNEEADGVVDDKNCRSPLGPEELRAADTLALMKKSV